MPKQHNSAMHANDVEVTTGTDYPEALAEPVAARRRRALGNAFGLGHYIVNLVELPPGSWSAQRHWHTHEKEFVFVQSGTLTLVTDEGRQTLTAGMVAGFPAGESSGHHLVNENDAVVSYLEIGDRVAADEVHYPDVDLQLISDRQGRTGLRAQRRTILWQGLKFTVRRSAACE